MIKIVQFIQSCNVALHFLSSVSGEINKMTNSPNHVCYVTLKALLHSLPYWSQFSKTKRQNTSISLRCLICMKLSSLFASPSTFVPYLLCWVQKYQNNTHFKVMEMWLLYLELLVLVFPMPWKWSPHKHAWLFGLVFGVFLHSDHSCLRCVFSKEFTLSL